MKLKNVFKNALSIGMSFLMLFAISSCGNTANVQQKYKVEYMVKEESKANGSVKAKLGTDDFTSSNLVESGKTISFIAEPNAGFEVEKWMVNGKDKTPATNKTKLDLVIQENTLVVVSFVAQGGGGGSEKAKVEFEVDPAKKHGGITAKNGTDSVVSGDMVQKGSSIVFNALPDENYVVDKWMVNNVDKTSEATDDNKKLTLTVTENTKVVLSYKAQGGGGGTGDNVKLTFSFNRGKITAKIGGTAVQNGDTVAKGSTVDFEVTFRTGSDHYEIDKWMVNNQDKTPSTEKTKLQLVINEETDVKVSAKLKQYSVTFSSNDESKGTVAAVNGNGAALTTGNKVDALQNVTFTATAATGGTFKKWTVGGVDQTPGTDPTKLTIAISKDTVVQAVFE